MAIESRLTDVNSPDSVALASTSPPPSGVITDVSQVESGSMTSTIVGPPGPPGPTGPQGPAGASITPIMQFSYNAAITEPPTGNQLRLNNADQTLATRIWVQKVTTDNIDVATFFYLYGLSGNLFYAQDRDDSTKRQRYTLTADGLDKGTYYEFQVSWLSGGLALPTQTVACALRGAVREG